MQKAFEKIVERLEEQIKKDCTIYENDSFVVKNTKELIMIPYRNAIKIVNKLAEEYKQEVCEWKGFDNSLDKNVVDWVYETTCGKYISESHTSSAFQFCPYCCKKIKVIE